MIFIHYKKIKKRLHKKNNVYPKIPILATDWGFVHCDEQRHHQCLQRASRRPRLTWIPPHHLSSALVMVWCWWPYQTVQSHCFNETRPDKWLCQHPLWGYLRINFKDFRRPWYVEDRWTKLFKALKSQALSSSAASESLGLRERGDPK